MERIFLVFAVFFFFDDNGFSLRVLLSPLFLRTAFPDFLPNFFSWPLFFTDAKNSRAFLSARFIPPSTDSTSDCFLFFFCSRPIAFFTWGF